MLVGIRSYLGAYSGNQLSPGLFVLGKLVPLQPNLERVLSQSISWPNAKSQLPLLSMCPRYGQEDTHSMSEDQSTLSLKGTEHLQLKYRLAC